MAKFQRAYGLAADSLPGPLTLSKLKAVELQKAIRAKVDGLLGPDSRKRVDAVRRSSTYGGRKFPYGVAYAQSVVGTPADGSWGAKSVTAHDRTVSAIQLALGVTVDSVWGKSTDSAAKALGV